MNMEQEYKHIVATHCLTYNHAPYIKDAMNGFCMQETTFPFVCIIIDDASTDGEPEVINNYLQEHFDLDGEALARNEETEDYRLIFAQHKTNRNCFFAVFFLKYNHYSIKKAKRPYFSEWDGSAKYIALCEGDDYWIHPKKLQMQVEFMENHPEYVMCHTDFDLSNGKMRNHANSVVLEDNYFPYSITHGIQIGTLTTLYRTDVFLRLPRLYVGKGWHMGDKPLWIELSHEGKIRYIPIVTAHYRQLSNSASHGGLDKEIEFANAGIEVKRFYASYYGIELQNNGLSKRYYTTMMKCAYKHRRKDVARRYYKEAREMNLSSIRTGVFYFATIFTLVGWLLRKIYRDA